MTRDPFLLPPKLREVFRQKDTERERLAREAQAQRGQSGSRPPEAQISSLKLQGLLWGNARPQAIINRRILSVGDTIEQAEILAVSKEGVTVLYNGREVQLKLPELGGRERTSR